MQTDAARRLIKETFERPFDKQLFTVFVKNLLNRIEEAPFTYRGNLIFDDFKDRVESLERIGKYTDQEGSKADILVVHLKHTTSLDRARTAQRQFVAKYLKGSRGGELKDAALVAFVSPDEEDWRFSFVKMEYKIETTDKGRVRAKEEFTPAKRYSFLVGKNENSHTAQVQLLPILQDTDHNPTLKDIEDKFSVEKVTKEFFEKYRELFLEIKEALDNLVKKDKNIKADFESKGVETIDFAKKLLGQIVFLYFLQKKGWFGVSRNSAWGTGPKNFLRLLYERKLTDYDNFFNDTLEPLFYEALASEREADYYSKFKCKVPFLNGGLFDPINNYDWVHTDIFLPNELFSNKEKTKQGDIGTGILDVFDRYNFTVKEDEPLEKEVAVDPEMLGKVFENLLEVKDRKSKGTYYTPREIVHYMCKESLINYLATELEGTVDHGDIETLVKHGETALDNDIQVLEKGKETLRYSFKLPDSTRDHTDLIDQKLADIKVCDPAVGSGAFLVGMMTEIIRTRSILTEFLSKSEGRSAYNLKRHAIQNSLYGVDIDLGAVEIAKLRLWLSLIVDEEDYRNIKPLPNLDYKIMQGNSLLEEYEGIKLVDERFFAKTEDKEAIRKQFKESQSDLQREYFALHTSGKLTPVKKLEIEKRLKEIDKLLAALDTPTSNGQDSLSIFGKSEIQAKAEKLLKLHEAFFAAYRKREKDKLKEQIDQFTWDLIEVTLKQQKKSEQLKDIKIYQQTNTKPFFLWRLNFADVFEQRNGFDIVVANPPYGADIDDQTSQFRRIYPGVITHYADIFKLFFALALDKLLRTNGVLIYITPNTFLSQPRHGDLRNYLLQKNIRTILNLGMGVFPNVVVPVSVSIVKNSLRDCPYYHFADLRYELQSASDLSQLNFVRRDFAAVLKSKDQSLFPEIDLQEDEKYFDEVFEIRDAGIQYHRSGIGLKNKGGSDLYSRIFADKHEKKFKKFVPTWYGKLIDRYWMSSATTEIFNLEYRGQLKANESVSFSQEAFGISEKLLWRQTASDLRTVLDSKKRWFRNTIQCAWIKDEYKEKVDISYALALFNSRLISYKYNLLVQEEGRVFPQVKIGKVKRLPIRICGRKEQEEIAKIVGQILQITVDDNYPADLRKQDQVKCLIQDIDNLIFKIYKLTPEEIAVVEGRKK